VCVSSRAAVPLGLYCWIRSDSLGRYRNDGANLPKTVSDAVKRRLDAQGAAVRGWRRPIGTLPILTPLLIMVGLGLLGVLLGSMGMDIHWNSRGTFYVATTCSVLILCACVVAGVSLTKKPANLEDQLADNPSRELLDSSQKTYTSAASFTRLQQRE
jgi:hypothetical protein